MTCRYWLLPICCCLLLLTACDKPTPPEPAAEKVVTESPPPAPPVHEDFEGEPQLSLFPRLSDFRPEDADNERLSYWRTYIEHLSKVSGVIDLPLPLTHHRAFNLRGIGGLESAGFFAPLAVQPDTAYRLTAWLRTKLPAGASAGIGFLEFDEFLWVGEQYPRSLAEKHQTGAWEGIRLSGTAERQVDIPFRTGPKTHMLHLVFFLEKAEREGLLIDDIRFEAAQP